MPRLLIVLSVLGLAWWTGLAIRRYVGNATIPSRFDRRDVDIAQPGPVLVEFTSPYCHECQVALPVLQAAAQAHKVPLAVVDAKTRPDLTAKYSIRTTPTILVVDPGGKVTAGWFTSPAAQDLSSALEIASGRRPVAKA